jgi:uncharacterized protein (TIGR02246 family)
MSRGTILETAKVPKLETCGIATVVDNVISSEAKRRQQMKSRRKLAAVAPICLAVIVVTIVIASSFRSGSETFAAAQIRKSSPVLSPEIARVRAEWAKDLHAKQLDQIAALYAEDAEFLLATGTRVSGRAAIRELCKNVMATMTSDITLRTATSERSENLAYDSGDYSETLTSVADGSVTPYKGTYVMIFRRQANGEWVIAEQVWTDASPASH